MAYQSITILGNLGGDPEMRFLPDGTPVCNFSMAVGRKWTNAAGTQQEKTTWFRVAAWRKQAELATQYLHKGNQVLVIGEMDEPNVWTDKDGAARASLEVTARQIQFVNNRSEGDGSQQATVQEHSSDVKLDDVAELPF